MTAPLCIDLPADQRSEIDRIASRDMVTPETVAERAVTEWLRLTVGDIESFKERAQRSAAGKL